MIKIDFEFYSRLKEERDELLNLHEVKKKEVQILLRNEKERLQSMLLETVFNVFPKDKTQYMSYSFIEGRKEFEFIFNVGKYFGEIYKEKYGKRIHRGCSHEINITIAYSIETEKYGFSISAWNFTVDSFFKDDILIDAFIEFKESLYKSGDRFHQNSQYTLKDINKKLIETKLLIDEFDAYVVTSSLEKLGE